MSGGVLERFGELVAPTLVVHTKSAAIARKSRRWRHTEQGERVELEVVTGDRLFYDVMSIGLELEVKTKSQHSR